MLYDAHLNIYKESPNLETIQLKFLKSLLWDLDIYITYLKNFACLVGSPLIVHHGRALKHF